MKQGFILTVEHASKKIPNQYKILKKKKVLINSYDSYDIGALDIARKIAKHFKALVHKSVVSRLIVDCNRSPHNTKALFKRFQGTPTKEEKEAILTKYYYPYWNEGKKKVSLLLHKKKKVFNLAVHSFTPFLDGKQRTNDIGLLYRPWIKEEKTFCHLWAKKIKKLDPSIEIRFNYPYIGASDCFLNHCSDKEFPERQKFFGVFLELNQKNLLKSFTQKKIIKIIIPSLEQTIKEHPWFS